MTLRTDSTRPMTTRYPRGRRANHGGRACEDRGVGKRSRNRKTVATADYTDDAGNVLTLRHTTAKVPEPHATAASSMDDAWHRRNEIRFERYAVRWVVSGLAY